MMKQRTFGILLFFLAGLTAGLHGQPPGRGLEDVPASPFRDSLLEIGPQARADALRRFNDWRIPMADVASLRSDRAGMLFYVCFSEGVQAGCGQCAGCGHSHAADGEEDTAAQPIFDDFQVMASEPLPASGPVPISSPPIFHSKPGASKVIYLDFNGGIVTGKAWNSSVSSFSAHPYSTDSDYTTFSDSEQAAIRRIWQRVAEDYAPFDVNVTTDPAYDPENTTSTQQRYIGWILVTRDVDQNGADMPAKGAGGVAYVNVFGVTSPQPYSYYQPAFVYYNNLGGGREDYVAEASSHEMGHNMGLSHDGTTSGSEYYSGHGSGDVSWAPIMGNSYNKNVSHWSKGEYYLANQTQDDLAIIAGKVGYRADDHGDTIATATQLVIDGSTIRAPVTRTFVGDEPNEGIIERPADVDMFSFETGGGTVTLTVQPFLAEANTRGHNLDVKLTLRDSAGVVVAAADPPSSLSATISTPLPAGTYFLAVEGTGVGSPLANPPSGYTGYGSLGMYFISGTVPSPLARVVAQAPAADAELPSGQGQLALTFNKPMDPESFSLGESILSFTGPGGIDLRDALTSHAWSAGDTVLTVFYASQSAEGYYRLVLSADVTDLDGWPLDQNENRIPGEVFADDYTALFRIANPVPPGTQVLLARDMAGDPGFTLDPGWEWGVPSQGAVGGPNSGHTGSTVLAYNLSGRYEANISPPRRARLPAVSTEGASGIQLQFRRWLGVALNSGGNPANRHADYARIQYSTNGSTWTDLWANGSQIIDTGWTLQSYPLPAAADNQPALHLRFSLESDGRTESFGWNIDDLVVTATVAGGSTPPPPPVVIGHSPAEIVDEPQSAVYFAFSQPMDPASFTLGDIAGFSGPSGAIATTGFSWLTSTLLRVDFPEQSEPGTYEMALSESVQDIFGQPLAAQGGEASPASSYVASFTIAGEPVLSSAEEWRLFFFGTTENAGTAADDFDFDGDGLVNLLERAFGTDPTDVGSRYQPVQSLDPADGQVYLALTYRQIAGGTGQRGVDYTAEGLTYTIEYHDALTGEWSSGDITVLAASDPDEDGFETVSVRRNTPLTPGAPQFIRLRVTP